MNNYRSADNIADGAKLSQFSSQIKENEVVSQVTSQIFQIIFDKYFEENDQNKVRSMFKQFKREAQNQIDVMTFQWAIFDYLRCKAKTDLSQINQQNFTIEELQLTDFAIYSNIQKLQKQVIFSDDQVLIDEKLLKDTITRLIQPGEEMKIQEFSEMSLHLQIDRLFLEASKRRKTTPDDQGKLALMLQETVKLNRPEATFTSKLDGIAEIQKSEVPAAKGSKTPYNQIANKLQHKSTQGLRELYKMKSSGLGCSYSSIMDIVNISKNRDNFISQTSNEGSLAPTSQPQKIRKGAHELYENIFGQKLEDDKSYTKGDLVKISGAISDSDDRQFMIQQLLDNIFENKQQSIDKQHLIESIMEQIQHDKFFKDEDVSQDSILDADEIQIGVHAGSASSRSESVSSDTTVQEVPVHMEMSNVQKQQQQRTRAMNSTHSMSRRPAEILNLVKERFFIQINEQKRFNLDEIKGKNMLVYDNLSEHQNNNTAGWKVHAKLSDKAEDLMIEMQQLIMQEKQNQSESINFRINEILLYFYKFIDDLEGNIEDKQNELEIMENDLNMQQEQEKEIANQRQREIQKNLICMKYNEQLVNDMTYLDQEYNVLVDQQLQFIKENKELVNQVNLLERQNLKQLETSHITPKKTPTISIEIKNKTPKLASDNNDLRSKVTKQQLDIENLNLKLKQKQQINMQIIKESQDLKVQNAEQLCRIDELVQDKTFLEQKVKSLKEENKILKEEPVLRPLRQRSVLQITRQNSPLNSLYDLEQDNDYKLTRDIEGVCEIPSNFMNTPRHAEPAADNFSRSSSSNQIEQYDVQEHTEISNLANPLPLQIQKNQSLDRLFIKPYQSPKEVKDISEYIEQSNKNFKVMTASDFSDLFSEMPKIEKTLSYQEFSFALIKQQEFLLKQICQQQKQIASIHADYKQEIKEVKSSTSQCVDCMKLQMRVDKLEARIEKYKEQIAKQKQIKSVNINFNNNDIDQINIKQHEHQELSFEAPADHLGDNLMQESQMQHSQSTQVFSRRLIQYSKLDELKKKHQNILHSHQKKLELSFLKTQQINFKQSLMDNDIKILKSPQMGYNRESKLSEFSEDDFKMLNQTQEERHHQPMTATKTQQELEALKKTIESQYLTFNLICDPKSDLNQDGGMKLQQIFANINESIGAVPSGQPPSAMDEYTTQEFPISHNINTLKISEQTDKMDLYTDQIYLYHNKKMMEALMVILKNTLYLKDMDGFDIPSLPPLNLLTDIKQIIKSLRQNKREEYQSMAMEISTRSTSHLVIIQKSRKQFKQLIDFINYQIFSSGQSLNELAVKKISPAEKFDWREHSETRQFCFNEMGSYKLENEDKRQKQSMVQRQLKDVVLKRIKGIIQNHWVNCFMELQQPSAYAHYIIKKFDNLAQNTVLLQKDSLKFQEEIQQFIIFNFGQNYRKDFLKQRDVESKAILIENIMKKFKYIIELKVGVQKISDNKISEVIELNSESTMTVLKGSHGAHETTLQSDTIGAYLNDHLIQSDKQLSFILTIKGEDHQFAALDGNNQHLLKKWIDKLKNVQEILQSENGQYDRKLNKIKNMVKQIVNRKENAELGPPATPASIQKRQVNEISGKYKTLSKQQDEFGFKSLTEFKARRESQSTVSGHIEILSNTLKNSTFKLRRDTVQQSILHQGLQRTNTFGHRRKTLAQSPNSSYKGVEHKIISLPNSQIKKPNLQRDRSFTMSNIYQQAVAKHQNFNNTVIVSSLRQLKSPSRKKV